LLIGIISVILTELLVFNAGSTKAYSRLGRQQFTIQDAFTRLNRDIEEAEEISFADSFEIYGYKTIILKINGTSREWKIDGGRLYLDSVAVVEGLSDESKFEYYSNEKCLAVVLKPVPTNEGRFALNLNKPIVSQYSLLYKEIN